MWRGAGVTDNMLTKQDVCEYSRTVLYCILHSIIIHYNCVYCILHCIIDHHDGVILYSSLYQSSVYLCVTVFLSKGEEDKETWNVQQTDSDSRSTER